MSQDDWWINGFDARVSASEAYDIFGAQRQKVRDYDVSMPILSMPTDGAVLAHFLAVRPFTLPQNLPNSRAESTTAPTSAASYTIKQNGSSIGSVDFASASNVATFTFSADVNVVAGDEITLEAPGTADATHDGITVTLVGTLVGSLMRSGEVLDSYPVIRAFTLPAGLSGSKARSKVNPTAAVSYDIQKNEVSIGSIDFALGSNIATFTFAAEVSFAVGDVLDVVAPATIDDTHDFIAWAFLATLVG